MKKLLISLLGMCLCAAAFAQDYAGYSASIFTKATSLPSISIIKAPIHPGLRLAKNWSQGRKDGKEHYGFRELAIGAFHHKQFQNSVYATYNFGYHRELGLGIHAEAMAGLGYMHSFSGKAIYKPQDNGDWKQVADWGRPNVVVSTQLGLGYDIKGFPLKPFIRYELMMQGPWAPENGFFTQPHTAFHIGAAFSF
ncbi:MAG: hypothetical protein AB8F95_15660 [Bacteroidia bacterium]